MLQALITLASVFVAAGLAALGYAGRSTFAWRREVRGSLGLIQTFVSKSDERNIRIDRDLSVLNLAVPTLKETVAVLASVVEDLEEDVKELQRLMALRPGN